MGIFGNAFTGWHIVLILLVVVLLFGATKLPALAKSVGQSVRILRNETRHDKDAKADGAIAHDATAPLDEPTPTPTPPSSSDPTEQRPVPTETVPTETVPTETVPPRDTAP